MDTPLWKKAEELVNAACYIPKDQWFDKLGLTVRKLTIKTRSKEIVMIVPDAIAVTAHYEVAAVSADANPGRTDYISLLTAYTVDGQYISRAHDNWSFNDVYNIVDDPGYELPGPFVATKEFFDQEKPLILFPVEGGVMSHLRRESKVEGEDTNVEKLIAIRSEAAEIAQVSHPDDE